ncbi:hypothetical protein [Pseudazoarcus pumilus]|uniref:hypothetical protein n=1 Tax=Pseudazoarcus pumilus TaxID=2067960 RepID=UPI000F4DBBBA|nr:hypothetical protein [Pseudazoarcus pumilus]
MTKCSGCGYVRQESDAGSLAVCPRCNVPYLWSAGEASQGDEAEAPPRSVRATRLRKNAAATGEPQGVRDVVISALVLAVGCFAPLMSVPLVGSITATQLRFSDGYVLLALAGLAVWFAYSDKVRLVRWPGWAALGIVTFDFVALFMRVQQAKTDMQANLEGNPFAGIAEAMAQSIQLQWGWVPLFAGAIGLVLVGHGRRLPVR